MALNHKNLKRFPTDNQQERSCPAHCLHWCVCRDFGRVRRSSGRVTQNSTLVLLWVTFLPLFYLGKWVPELCSIFLMCFPALLKGSGLWLSCGIQLTRISGSMWLGTFLNGQKEKNNTKSFSLDRKVQQTALLIVPFSGVQEQRNIPCY